MKRFCTSQYEQEHERTIVSDVQPEPEVEWPEPADDPEEEPSESKENDGTPGAVEEED